MLKTAPGPTASVPPLLTVKVLSVAVPVKSSVPEPAATFRRPAPLESVPLRMLVCVPVKVSVLVPEEMGAMAPLNVKGPPPAFSNDVVPALSWTGSASVAGRVPA